MKRRLLMLLVIVVVATISAAVMFENYAAQPSKEGFRLISLEDNALLISDSDILSYNWTSQEIAIADEASERLIKRGDNLYSFTGFVIKIDAEEVYRGVFRRAIHSAIPGSPRISVLFPSVLFPSDIENDGAIRMFYPSCEPPSDMPEQNVRISKHFESAGKLTQ